MATFYNDGTFIPDAPPKDPDSTIDYGLDWSNWLASGETITASSWPETGGLVNESESFTTSKASIFVSGGTVGASYTLTNRISTNFGRTEDRSMLISCQEK